MTMERDVYVIGVGIHRFGKHDVSRRDMHYVAGITALEDAGLSFKDVGALYTGFIGGAMLDGVTYAKDLGLTGLPVVHIENASATGSSAFREAVMSVAGGSTEVAMAIGFDGRLGNVAQAVGPRRPSMDTNLLPAAFFAFWAVRRMHDNGTTVETYAKIAAKNWNHARFNKYAERQAEQEITPEVVLAAPLVAYPHTAMMACGAGAGAAAAIVATRQVAERLANGRPLVRVAASQMQSERYQPGHVFLGAIVGPSESTRITANLAYEEAGLGPEDLDLVHVHDAFPIEELMYYELLGICPEGEGDRLVAEGATTIGGRIPFSTDGGLIGRGHPGGPTGLAQIWDVTQQLRGESGVRQVEGAQVGLAHMMGAGSVCVVHILQRES
ncbi:MAG: thiolase family protein [Dehalococcoidia bacterium]|nr:thiolase family protein [Dehalococcoidia bacterium]